MATSTPSTNESVRLQQEIEAYLAVSGKLYFDFTPEDHQIRLALVTLQEEHRQPFLLHSQMGEDNYEALQKMLVDLKETLPKLPVFEVTWYKKALPEKRYISHFQGATILEVLKKCYYQTKPNRLTVVKVELLEKESESNRDTQE